MRVFKKFQFTFLILLFASFVPAQSLAEGLSKSISEIASGANSSERGEKIRESLEKVGVKFVVEAFSAKGRNGNEIKGMNIIAEIPNRNAAKTIMLGAHYDKVPVGQGAVDNASGSAAILELLKMFKSKPLENYNLKIAFWDLEENGLLGSREYIKARSESELPAIYVNFDVFGYGDTLWLWTQNEKSFFSKAVEETAKKANAKSKISTQYPPSDHLAFAQTKTETYSFSLLNGDEIPRLLKLLKGENLKENEFPRVLQIIHTNNDTVEKIDANEVAKALPLVEQAIRKLDN